MPALSLSPNYLDCIHTIVKNMSGVQLYFGFLPPHGVKLDAGAEYAIRGDLVTRIAAKNDQDRAFPSFQKALDDTDIVIIHSPAVFIYDNVSDTVQQLTIRNRVVGVMEPCWGYFSNPGGVSEAGL